jgi:hypothetical protein
LYVILRKKKAKKSVENKPSENIRISKYIIDTLIIKSKSAVIVEPSESNIEKRKKEVGEENFCIGADDYLFYHNESINFLDKQEIKIV